MDMTQVSKSNIIYGSVNEFVEVHKSLLDSPEVKKLFTNLKKL